MNYELDLTIKPPRSPKEKLGGYVILPRTIDKCRAFLFGKVGEYHFDCPLDNRFFSFKEIKAEDFKEIVKQRKTDEEILEWVNTHGIIKTGEDIENWSEKEMNNKFDESKDQRAWFEGELEKLNLDKEKTTLFDWLEKDDAILVAVD